MFIVVRSLLKMSLQESISGSAGSFIGQEYSFFILIARILGKRSLSSMLDIVTCRSLRHLLLFQALYAQHRSRRELVACACDNKMQIRASEYSN